MLCPYCQGEVKHVDREWGLDAYDVDPDNQPLGYYKTLRQYRCVVNRRHVYYTEDRT